MSRYVVSRYYPTNNESYTYEAKPNVNTKQILNIYKGLDTKLSLRLSVMSILDKKYSKTYRYNIAYEEITEQEYIQLIKQLQLKHAMGI